MYVGKFSVERMRIAGERDGRNIREMKREQKRDTDEKSWYRDGERRGGGKGGERVPTSGFKRADR